MQEFQKEIEGESFFPIQVQDKTVIIIAVNIIFIVGTARSKSMSRANFKNKHINQWDMYMPSMTAGLLQRVLLPMYPLFCNIRRAG